MRFLTCSRKGDGDVKTKKAFLTKCSKKGTTADVSDRATTVHNPWNELTDSRRFVLP